MADTGQKIFRLPAVRGFVTDIRAEVRREASRRGLAYDYAFGMFYRQFYRDWGIDLRMLKDRNKDKTLAALLDEQGLAKKAEKTIAELWR